MDRRNDRPTHRVSTFLSEREAHEIERLARDQERSVAAQVRLVLREHLTRHETR